MGKAGMHEGHVVTPVCEGVEAAEGLAGHGRRAVIAKHLLPDAGNLGGDGGSSR